MSDRIETYSANRYYVFFLPRYGLTCKAYKDVQSSASSLLLADGSKGSRSSRESLNRNERDNDQLDHNIQPVEI